MTSKSTIRPLPSPTGRNDENLYLRTTIERRPQLGQDAAPDNEARQFVASLRRKFKTPRAAMAAATAALGLDAADPDSLKRITDMLCRHVDDEHVVSEILKEIRIATGDALSREEEDGSQYGESQDRRSKGRDHIPSAAERHVSPVQNEGDDAEPSEELLLRERGETSENIRRQEANRHPRSDPRGSGGKGGIVGAAGDHDDDPLDDFKRHLEKNGMDQAEIEEVTGLARDYLRRRANGRDRDFGKDRFPLRSHSGPIADPAMDAAHKARLMARYPNLARISVGPEARRLSGDRRLAHDQARPPSRAQAQRTLRRFPGMAAIGTSANADYVFRDPASFYR